MWGSWVFFLVKGKLGNSRRFAEKMLTLGEGTGSSDLLVEARWALGNSHYWLGEMEAARTQLEMAVAAYDPGRHRSHALLFGQDPGVAAHCYLSFVYWMLGRPQDSAAALASAGAIAESLDHPFTTAWPMAFQILLSSHDHDPQTGLSWSERLIRFSEEQKQQYWLQAAIIIRGWSLAGLGNVADGVQEMRRGIASYAATGAGVSLPHFYGLLAETLVEARQYDEATQALELAFDHARANMERAAEVNLWRIKGNLLFASDRSAATEAIDCYGTALRVAEHCAALAPGLRAAAALHRALAEHRPAMLQASPLPGMLNRFPAGASSRYLKDARTLLAHHN
jgi:adenylate cyclase